eukprot:326721_1
MATQLLYIVVILSIIATLHQATRLTTTLIATNAQNGNMFDICAINYVEISRFDINCNAADSGIERATVEIYAATSTGQSATDITSSILPWTLIHRENVTCNVIGTLTPLSRFNLATEIIKIHPDECRGFYVTRTNGSLGYTVSSNTVAGKVYVSNSDIQVLEGYGKVYPFGIEWEPRIWNGRITYTTDITPDTFSSCDTNKYCHYNIMYPIPGRQVSQTVTAESYFDNTAENFEFHFTMLNQDCINPKVSFVMQETDFNSSSKYLDVIDITNGYTIIKQCQGTSQGMCPNTSECLNKQSIATTTIPIYNTHIFRVNRPWGLSIISPCSYAIWFQFTIQCGMNPPPTTSSPTTPYPSVSPTTPYPTSINEYVLCGNNRYCWYKDLIPVIGNNITDTIEVISYQSGIEENFEFHYTVQNLDCINPSISFNMEETDFDGADEYLDIIDQTYNTQFRCHGSGQAQCPSNYQCLNKEPVQVSVIKANTTHIFSVYKPNSVHTLAPCNFAVKFIFKIHCEKVTLSPTKNPTISPTTIPTISPSKYPTTYPSKYPTTYPSKYP